MRQEPEIDSLIAAAQQRGMLEVLQERILMAHESVLGQSLRFQEASSGLQRVLQHTRKTSDALRKEESRLSVSQSKLQ